MVTCHSCKKKFNYKTEDGCSINGKYFCEECCDNGKQSIISFKNSEFKPRNKEHVNHPSHYGGKNNPYEAIKVIEHCGLDFHAGNAVKYILRAGKKDSEIQDLEKAVWYLQRKINNLKNK